VGKSAVPPAAPLEVIVRRDQSLMLRERDKGRADERAVSSAQLVAALQERQKKSPDQPVVISRGQGRALRGGAEGDGRAAAAQHPPGRAAGEARDTMSYAIQRTKPGAPRRRLCRCWCTGVLFALLVFSLHWQSKHPDPVVAELWTELPAFEPPAPKVEPKPEVKPAAQPEPKIEQKASKPDIALERGKEEEEGGAAAQVRCDPAHARAARAGAAGAQPQPREAGGGEAVAPPAASVGDPATSKKFARGSGSNIIPPSELKGNPEAIFDVVQLPTGEVFFREAQKNRAATKTTTTRSNGRY